MTADVELLPLPSVLLNWPHPTNHAAILDYARANVAHHVAPLKYALENAARSIKTLREVRDRQAAEIEALREQLDWAVKENDRLLAEGSQLTTRAERLAETLRDAMGYINSMNYPGAIAKIDALLRDQEEGK